jgi:CrcB protein
MDSLERRLALPDYDDEARIPVDPDIDLHVPMHHREGARTSGMVLAVIALGGMLGALTRYGVTVAIPYMPGSFPSATFLINVSGCFLSAVLMVLITERYHAHPLLRPFLGVGVLGGFTTFSTYAEEVRALLNSHRTITGLGYLAGTVAGAIIAVWLGIRLTRLVIK